MVYDHFLYSNRTVSMLGVVIIGVTVHVIYVVRVAIYVHDVIVK